MANEGFRLLGDVLGGGIDREGARLEGLLLGGKTQDALAKAKIRRDEAEQRLLLEESLGKLGFQGETAAGGAGIARAGVGNISQISGALGDLIEQATRSDIRDPEATPELGDINRALASLASGPQPGVEGVGAGLTTDIFGPEAGGVDVAPTGEADIEATRQLGLLREAKRLHPELFRNVTNIGLGGTPGADDPLGDLIAGETIVPEDFDPQAALGLGGAVREAANIIGGLVDLPDEAAGIQLQAPETRKANAILEQLATISTLEGVVAIPGRPTNAVREMFAGLEVHPRDVLNGDARALEKWRRQLALYEREANNIEKRLRAGTVKAGTSRFDDNVQAAQILRGLQADFQAVLDAFEANKDGDKKVTGAGELEIGGTIEIEGGSIERVE